MRLGFGPQDWDLGLETGIWASRLGFEGGGTEEEEEEEEVEKIPHMGESIGHRPLRGPCPTRRGFLKVKLNLTNLRSEAQFICRLIKLKVSIKKNISSELFLHKTRSDTRPIPVADGWAGAEMCVFAVSQLHHPYGSTNRPTDRPTDGRTKPLIESLVRD